MGWRGALLYEGVDSLYLYAILSGIVQGLCEFLPISSSGHLAIVGHYFGGKSSVGGFTFGVMLHLSTLLAVVIVCRRDVIELVTAFFSLIKKLLSGRLKDGLTSSERYVVCVVVATLPMALAILVDDRVEALFSDVRFIGATLIANAAILALSDIAARRADRRLEKMTPLDALVVGLVQLVAVIPGLSRSGTTVTGGLIRRIERRSAMRFSFIMSIPTILGACVFELPEVLTTPIPQGELLPIALGMVAALVSGIAAIKFFGFVAEKNNFKIFSLYCAVLGTAVLIIG